MARAAMLKIIDYSISHLVAGMLHYFAETWRIFKEIRTNRLPPRIFPTPAPSPQVARGF
jgi:hypothetical protein